MRSKIGLQSLAVILVFLMWNTLRLKQEALIDEALQKLGAVPVLVISEDKDELVTVADTVRSLAMVREIEVETPDDVKRRLLQRLEESAGHTLDDSSRGLLLDAPLPGMVHIAVHPERFTAASRDSLYLRLRNVRPAIIVRYNEEFWRERWDEVRRLERVQLLYEAFFAALALLTAVMLRTVYANRQDEYWRIVRRAGGDVKRRRRIFWRNSLVIVLLPSIVSLGALVGYPWLTTGGFTWPYVTLAMQTGSLLLAMIISWIALKEKMS